MPVYQGKTAKQWMYASDGTSLSKEFDAFKDMGSNAVPFLIHELARKDSAWEKFSSWIRPKLPQSISKHISWPKDSHTRRSFAYSFLISESSRTAVGPLLQVLVDGDPVQQYWALEVLSALEQSTDTDWIPHLTACLNSPAPGVCLVAAQMLKELNAGELAIPALTNLLTPTNSILRFQIISQLKLIDTTNSEKWNQMLTNEPTWQKMHTQKRVF